MATAAPETIHFLAMINLMELLFQMIITQTMSTLKKTMMVTREMKGTLGRGMTMTAVQTKVVLKVDFSHEIQVDSNHEVRVDSSHEVEKVSSQEIKEEVFRVGVSLTCPILMRGGTHNRSEKRGK